MKNKQEEYIEYAKKRGSDKQAYKARINSGSRSSSETESQLNPEKEIQIQEQYDSLCLCELICFID